jgi:hypothetical protein
MTLIGVKSKYGSCNGNCTGGIILKKIFYIKYIYFISSLRQGSRFYFSTGSNPDIRKVLFLKEGSVCWLTGWAVNSIALKLS